MFVSLIIFEGYYVTIIKSLYYISSLDSNIQSQVTECDTIFFISLLVWLSYSIWAGMFQVQDGSFSDSVEIISNKPTY